MITGLRKADKTLARPFGAYMHVMRDEMLRCPRWLIVGYGFADNHINEAMTQARRSWQQRGQDAKAVIVNYHRPGTDHQGLPILDAWFGTEGWKALAGACGPVFEEDLNQFLKPLLPKIDPSLFTTISPSVAVHLGGTATALGPDVARVEAFLRQ